MTDLRELQTRLQAAFRWRGDRNDDAWGADRSGWWRQPHLLRALGPALADLFVTEQPTVVVGPESSGTLLGPLVAVDLGVGFVHVEKGARPYTDSDTWLRRTSPPDYADRHVILGFRHSLIRPSERVLMVDDWVDTGGQALTVQALVGDAGAHWVGVAAVVDATSRGQLRHCLQIRSLLHVRDL